MNDRILGNDVELCEVGLDDFELHSLHATVDQERVATMDRSVCLKLSISVMKGWTHNKYTF